METDKDGLTKFTDDGRPRWTIRPHDLEAFDAEVEQYGAWRSDISRFIAAHARLRMSKLTPEA